MKKAQELLELAERATAGPWAFEFTGEKSNDWSVGQVVGPDDQMIADEVPSDGDFVVVEYVAEGQSENLGDARFIAFARNNAEEVAQSLLALASELSSLKEREERLEEAEKLLNIFAHLDGLTPVGTVVELARRYFAREALSQETGGEG